METGLIGGEEKREIIIVEYDAAWPGKFERHALRLRGILGEAVLSIEHIGSTAVPGLAAKPIIDVMIVVRDSADETGYLPQLEAAGYELRVREPDWNEHRMFRTPERDVHIHVYSDDCPEIDRLLRFRNRLRSNPEDRKRYETIKRRLAVRGWSDMNAYASAKSEVIANIIAKA